MDKLDTDFVLSVEKLIDSMKFIVGIAERGVGRQIKDEEAVEEFVLAYVRGLESRLKTQEVKNAD